VFCDSQSTTHLASNPGHAEKSKQADTNSHYIQEHVALGFLKLMKTQLELTNLVTKLLQAEISGLTSPSWIQYISTSLPTRGRVLSLDRLTLSIVMYSNFHSATFSLGTWVWL